MTLTVRAPQASANPLHLACVCRRYNCVVTQRQWRGRLYFENGDVAVLEDDVVEEARIRLSLRRVRHRFDIVPIRADNERPVIVRVVHLADSRRAVVLTASGQGCSVKSTHLLAILGNERNVHRRLRLGVGAKPELPAFPLDRARPTLPLP
jgi:hypothetical protein